MFSQRILASSILPLLVLSLIGCQSSDSASESAFSASLPAGAIEAVNLIDEETLRTFVSDLAADAMEGRGPGTPGDLLAQQYIEDALSDAGLLPGGPDGSWRQPFDIVGITSDVPDTWTFGSGERSLELGFHRDFIAASGVQAATSTLADAEVVFVGYGIRAPEHDWNDFGDADLKGKVLLILNNDPDWDPEIFEGTKRLYYGRWDYKYLSAATEGAVGAIIIHTTPSAGYPWHVVQNSWTGEQFELPWQGEPRTQVNAWVTEQAAKQLVDLGGFELDELRQAARTRDFVPMPLGIHTSLKMSNTLTSKETANVLGLLPGSDPKLRDQVVVITAHHDHLGRNTDPNAADPIYNGAVDNASGVGMVLAAARAAAALSPAPRRSLLFAFVGAEEQGLLGSEHYATEPTFAPGRITANVNLDGGNRWGRTRDVASIGFGKSSLDDVILSVAAFQNRSVTPDQFPDRGYFYRSDQFNFAKLGVPALYIKGGIDFLGQTPEWGREVLDAHTEAHYHQPSDEVGDDWVWDGMVEDARLALLCTLQISQAEDLPTWKAGDEFEASRLAALAAVTK